MTSRALYRIASCWGARVVFGSQMVGRSDFPLMTPEAVNQIANVGVTFGTVPRGGCCGFMVAILLGNEGMAGRTITVGRHAFMTLVAEALII
ncbi:MAG: hypothetical protein RQ722_00370 [Desulfuromonadales bacterium]|nr:hypothetical protein [Desulfuromonadales bacterium]